MLKTELNYIAIVDFGSQYSHLIASCVRKLGVYSKIISPENFNPSSSKMVGVIFSGGPKSVVNDGVPYLNFNLSSINVPLLGICYGHQLIAYLLGGTVQGNAQREYGFSSLSYNNQSVLFRDLPLLNQQVWTSHSDHVVSLPSGFHKIASTNNIEIAGFESEDQKIFGLQFHPEVIHTPNGMKILENFLSICNAEKNWNPDILINHLIQKIQTQTNQSKLFILVSGGVDSLVTLKLCTESIPKSQIYPIHIDTGLMRLNESDDVVNYISTNFNLNNFKLINASDIFFENLKNIIDPEEKRKIIGKIFIEILQNHVKQTVTDVNDWKLVQGTIYPDTIESAGTAKSELIKTHHNRIPIIKQMIDNNDIIEPLSDLYKDEVRQVGKQLNLPDYLLNRHPFPGPGLAIRLICSNGLLPENYDKEYYQALEIASLFKFDVKILPVKSVGVQGDSRTYLYCAVIWRKDNSFFEWTSIQKCATLMVNSLKTVNRVLFSIKSLEDKKINLIEKYISKETVESLRQADFIANTYISLVKTDIWQMPVISLPLKINQNQNEFEVFVIRPVSSKNAMTADVFCIEFDLLNKIVEKFYLDKRYLFYDVTTKPPATIEFE